MPPSGAPPPFDIDPKMAAHRLADQQIRVDIVGLGTSEFTDSALDLAVADIEVSPTVFHKNTVVVIGRIRALGAADQTLTVRLLLEDPTSAEPGKSGLMRPIAAPIKIKPSRNQEVLPVEFSFILAGSWRIEYDAGGASRSKAKCRSRTIRRRRFSPSSKGGSAWRISIASIVPSSVFCAASTNPLTSAWTLNRSARGWEAPSSQIDPEWFDTENTTCTSSAASAPASSGPELLRNWPRRSIGGPGSDDRWDAQFRPGDAATPSRYPPVVTQRTEILQNPNEPDPSLHYDEPLKMLPTSQGLSHFVMRLESADKNRLLWESLPALNGANRSRRTTALVLAQVQGTRAWCSCWWPRNTAKGGRWPSRPTARGSGSWRAARAHMLLAANGAGACA